MMLTEPDRLVVHKPASLEIHHGLSDPKTQLGCDLGVRRSGQKFDGFGPRRLATLADSLGETGPAMQAHQR